MKGSCFGILWFDMEGGDGVCCVDEKFRVVNIVNNIKFCGVLEIVFGF